MSHPTCCCSVSLDRCDRCDLLVGLEGFHLMSVARTPDALVLDVESCIQLVGYPGCGVIAQGHGRVVVEVIDAPWAGAPARFRWHIRRWMCRETTCQTRDSWNMASGCAHLWRVWVCGRSAGRSDSCTSKEPPSPAWPDNSQSRGTPCGPISSRVCTPYLMTLPILRGFGCWGLMSMCGITWTDATAAHVNSLASWT